LRLLLDDEVGALHNRAVLSFKLQLKESLPLRVLVVVDETSR